MSPAQWRQARDAARSAFAARPQVIDRDGVLRVKVGKKWITCATKRSQCKVYRR